VEKFILKNPKSFKIDYRLFLGEIAYLIDMDTDAIYDNDVENVNLKNDYRYSQVMTPHS
jgi:hypothetical protein